MRPKSLILLVMALGCGLVAAVGINQVMSNRGDAGQTFATTPILVALEQIGIGDPIRPESLKITEWPTHTLPEGAITKLDEIEGRRARTIIYPGDPMVENKLLGKGETRASIDEVIPAGMRIVPVRVDSQSGLAGLVKPGDRVDLSVTLRADREAGINMPVTQTFLQNVKVAAIDSEWLPAENGTQPTVAKTISLLVTPAQVELVTMASEMGTIRFSMRSAKDEEIVDTPPVSPNEVVGNLAPTANGQNSGIDDLLKQLGAKPAEAPKPVQVAEAPVEPPKKTSRMIIWDGETPRLVTFDENGKPIDPLPPPAAGAGGTPAVPTSLSSP